MYSSRFAFLQDKARKTLLLPRPLGGWKHHTEFAHFLLIPTVMHVQFAVEALVIMFKAAKEEDMLQSAAGDFHHHFFRGTRSSFTCGCRSAKHARMDVCASRPISTAPSHQAFYLSQGCGVWGFGGLGSDVIARADELAKVPKGLGFRV